MNIPNNACKHAEVWTWPNGRQGIRCALRTTNLTSINPDGHTCRVCRSGQAGRRMWRTHAEHWLRLSAGLPDEERRKMQDEAMAMLNGPLHAEDLSPVAARAEIEDVLVAAVESGAAREDIERLHMQLPKEEAAQ